MEIARRSFMGIAACLLCSATGSAVVKAAEKDSNWSYAGDNGPRNWHRLSDDHAACAGDEQSPVDLTATHAADVEDIALHWQAFTPAVVNNGHTIQVNVPKGSYTYFGKERYELLQFHFHRKSEHTIEGKHSAMEVHFVHAHAGGELLVIGVMLEAGAENPEIGKIWRIMPSAKGEAKGHSVLDPTRLVPASANYYRYVGSLTTPPCHEIVHWSVSAQPLAISEAQIDAFAQLFANNNRPIQKLNRRFILFGK